MIRFARAFPILATALLAAGCSETVNPVAPPAPVPLPQVAAASDPAALLSLTCTGSTTSRTVHCDAPASDGGASRAVIIGGQNDYVRLTSSNVAVAADTFEFDVTVTNLIPQPIGTIDGTTAHPAGVRVFFNDGPVSAGPGTVTVANPTSTGTFTAAGQPYFQYDGILAQGETSLAKRWKLTFTPDVVNFTFHVYVSAEVKYPLGYVDGTPYVLSLDPSESVSLSGVVRSMVGTALPGETVDWSSDAPATAAVSGSQVTAGPARGFATLTPVSGQRPALYTTAVSVCQSTVVGNGASIPSSVAGTDCFSSYGDPSGRPTNSYYADLYRVTLTAGQTITVTMDSGDDLDTYLLLAAPATGALVAGNDDDDTGVLGVGSRVVYTATVSGVYVIEASTFNGLDTGNYTLGVSVQ